MCWSRRDPASYRAAFKQGFADKLWEQVANPPSTASSSENALALSSKAIQKAVLERYEIKLHQGKSQRSEEGVRFASGAGADAASTVDLRRRGLEANPLKALTR